MSVRSLVSPFTLELLALTPTVPCLASNDRPISSEADRARHEKGKKHRKKLRRAEELYSLHQQVLRQQQSQQAEGGRATPPQPPVDAGKCIPAGTPAVECVGGEEPSAAAAATAAAPEPKRNRVA